VGLTWIVQTNLVSERTQWIESLDALGSKYAKIEIIPFEHDVPHVEVEGPAIVYGSTTLIKCAPKHKNWNPGLFFDPSNFRPSKWSEKWGEEMLNHDGKVVKVKDVLDVMGYDCFMRPNDDLKDFSGSRVNREYMEVFVKDVVDGQFPFSPDLEVHISSMKPIYQEYRVFIVDGKPVAWSQYRYRSMLLKSREVPQSVIDYAQDMANIWSPEKAFVMDVCVNEDQKLKILELNCFNASGVYLCNIPDIIKAVERMF